ncbi:MAG: MraY family glycosyltransferase [Candidatus Shapirobacteria bacterium]|nr:MraY family glycosyltransferase [Candidatus Shapirobacteria bacterium]
MILKLILLPLIVAFLIAIISTPLAIKIAWKFGLIDDPKKRKGPAKLHHHPTPRPGVIPIWLAVIITSLIFLPLDKSLLGILGGATILFVLGILDDKYDLNPYLRLGGCFIAAGLVVKGGVGIFFITNPFGQGLIHFNQIIAIILALLWIAFLSNITNWSSGFDGQLPGIVVIAALTIAFLSFRFSADLTQWPITILAAVTAGAYLGFLPYNFFPQKIMTGYGGGILAGFLLAVLAILSTAKIGTTLVVLGIPFIDALYSIIRRIMAGKSPVWGDRGHLHHKLLDELHWGKKRTAVFYWTITAILGFLALNLHSIQKFYTIVMLVALIGSLLLWLNLFPTYFNRSDRDKPSKT